MIDAHCHLEQKDFDNILKEVIERCRSSGLRAVITCCAHPAVFEKTMSISETFAGFVFPTIGIHPEYINKIKENEKDALLDNIKKNRDKIVGIGEIGLDYSWIKERRLHERQQELFKEMLEFAVSLDKPVIIHIRGGQEYRDEAFKHAIKILEDVNPARVLLHLFSSKTFLSQIMQNGWFISIGPIIAHSKTIKKMARDMPLERILLETDSPWFGGKDESGRPLIGEPTNIRIPAAEIAKVKKLSFEDVWKRCGENAARFYKLDV